MKQFHVTLSFNCSKKNKVLCHERALVKKEKNKMINTPFSRTRLFDV